jgi:adenylyltransferase/sulfurtransferase
MRIIKDYDVIVDGCDNFATRYLVNDACFMAKKPNIHGSIFQFDGQATVFYPGKGPCYRCLYPEPPPPEMAPSCAEAGVLGVLPGLIGVIQALETIKLILGKGDALVGRLLCFNTLTMEITNLKLKQDPACPLCGEKPTIHNLIDYEEFCGLRAAHAA